MAENESLDLGGAHANRWNVPFDSIRNGASCKEATRRFEKALYGGLRKALRQWSECSVALPDLLSQRGSKQALHSLVRKTQGHQYAQLFAAAAAASSGTGRGECLRAWVDAILDKVFDQVCFQLTGTENRSSFYDVQGITGEVRGALEPVVGRIVEQFEKDPNWRPARAPSKDKQQADPTQELLHMSLLGAVKP